MIKKSSLHKHLKYLITQTPKDGVEASKNKLKIFQWNGINDYDKILFLDCDIISIGDVNNIFKENLEQDILYTAHNLNLTPDFFRTIYHGFEMLSLDFIEEMKVANQIPFNAGQFLFRNSDRMRSHFENIIWFMQKWPLQYFFEQAFMCYYFAKAYMCKSTILQDNVSIVSAKDKNLIYEITPKTTLIHFIAPPLNASTKLKFIDNFLKEKGYGKVLKESWFKKLFKKL